MRYYWVVVAVLFLFSLALSSYTVLGLNACCQKTTDGNFCSYTDESKCDKDFPFAYTSCEETSYCQTGCCYSSDTGSCYENTPKATCQAEDGTTWASESDCEIDSCQKGCCEIGDQAFFVTEVKCKSVASQYEDAAVSWNSDVKTEPDCLDSVKNLDWGCCVTEEDSTFTTREQCSVASSTPTTNFTRVGFHENMLCSNDLLATGCAKQQTTVCYQGKVYWADSCGNRENVYSSDTRTSYNSGYVLKEEDSCTASSPNDPNCGNCDYANGMTCGKDTEGVMAVGDYSCIDLNCEETYENSASPLSGQSRLNGESWCVYDGVTGQAKDTVGSRHYRHICINSEELTEPCTDFREELCINGELTKDVLGTLEALHLDNSDSYVEAGCRKNRNSDCNICNDISLSLADKYSCCTAEDTRDCYWFANQEVTDTENPPSGKCVPQVPSGLKFWSESGSGTDASSSSVCTAASTTCTAKWRLSGVRKLIGERSDRSAWQLVEENPDGCTSRSWLVAQNSYCKTLGDCGMYYNYVGDIGDGFSSTIFDETFFFDHADLNSNDLEDWTYLESSNSRNEEAHIGGFNSPLFWQNPITWIGLGSAIYGGTIPSFTSCIGGDKPNTPPPLPSIREGSVVESNEAAPPLFRGASKGGGSAVIGGVISQFFGCGIKSVLLGPFSSIGKLFTEKSFISSLNGLSSAAMMASVLYLAVEYLNEDYETRTYTTTCGVWQPPSGGENCEKCNDPNTPCSEYKCRSLGAACDLVNEGTGNETCVALNVNDVNSPVITPLEDVLSEGYTITPVEEEGNKGYKINEKIPAFTNVQVGVNTDEPSICKYSADPGKKYEEMTNPFGTSLYLYNHTMIFTITNELTNEEILKLTGGEYTIYLRCADAQGNANERDYFIRFDVDTTPDLTPPEIVYTSITSGAYMPYNASTTDFSVFTNEPSDCRWNTNDTAFEFMTGTMNCPNSGFEQSSVYYGTYECSTTLTGVAEKTENSYFLRCQDQAGNANEDSTVFVTRRTESPLEITSISPSGTVYDRDLTLDVETDGGALNGVSVCGFGTSDVDYYSMAQFATTNSTAHSQTLELIEGDYTFYVTCQDIAGNRASNSTSISIEVDTEPPAVESLYVDTAYSVLSVTMNEKSTCEYAFDTFTYGEGTFMTGVNETVHEASVQGTNYYLQCIDAYKNSGSYLVDLSAWV